MNTTEPQIVTTEEAQAIERAARVELEESGWTEQAVFDLAHTVATEPDRTRAAVVKALRDAARGLRALGAGLAADLLDRKANDIEKGEPA